MINYEFNPKRIVGYAWLSKNTRRPIYSATEVKAADLMEVHIKTPGDFKAEYVKPDDIVIQIEETS